jgi:hypothetical protein
MDYVKCFGNFSRAIKTGRKRRRIFKMPRGTCYFQRKVLSTAGILVFYLFFEDLCT